MSTGLILNNLVSYSLQIGMLVGLAAFVLQENQPICVVRVTGEAVDNFLEEIWNSGHRVLNVIRFPLKQTAQH